MDLKAIKTLTAAALLATATAASAGTSPFNMVSGPTTPGVDVSLTIQQSSMPGYDYDFVVTNSSLMGIVTGVYFEMDWNSLVSGAGTSSGPATLKSGSLDAQVSDWEGSTASHTVAAKAVTKRISRGSTVTHYYDNLGHGIQEGQVQVFSFTADTEGISLADLESMLGTDGYGVAIKMQGLTQNEQASGWGEADKREEELLVVQSSASLPDDYNDHEGEGEGNGNGDKKPEVTAAPSPTAALAGLAVMGIAGLRRRRK